MRGAPVEQDCWPPNGFQLIVGQVGNAPVGERPASVQVPAERSMALRYIPDILDAF